MRKLIKKYLVEIKDYPNQKLFDNAMTSSTIMFLRKGEYAEVVDYIMSLKKNKSLLQRKNYMENGFLKARKKIIPKFVLEIYFKLLWQ